MEKVVKRKWYRLKRVWIGTILLAVLVFITPLVSGIVYRLTGYAVKELCSGVFIGGLTLDEVREELEAESPFAKLCIFTLIDTKEKKSAKVSLLGLFPRTAVYDEWYGGVIVHPGYKEIIKNRTQPSKETINAPDLLSDWPLEVEKSGEFAKALEYAFDLPELRNTRAIVIIKDDQLLAEKYLHGFDRNSLFCGRSMTKSFLNIAIGRRIQTDPKSLSLDQTNLLDKWQDDKRSEISLEQLLRMESGLSFFESYQPLSDVVNMLSYQPDMGGFASSFSLLDDPPRWSYSSGVSNILSLILRRSFASQQDYVNFLEYEVLQPLGMQNTILEFDASGTWVASTYMYATGLEWARLGKVVIDNGKFADTQFLPKDWIKTSLSLDNNSNYGMHWWLNGKNAQGYQWLNGLPESLLTARGYGGQFVTILPEEKLIVVRLGVTDTGNKMAWDHKIFMSLILDELK